MGRGHLSEFADRFKRVLSSQTVNALGRLTRFCQRERVITPHRKGVRFNDGIEVIEDRRAAA